MKRVLICVLIVSCASSQYAPGQDFKKVVDIIVDIEASMKKMVDAEQSERKSQITDLKKEIADLRTSVTAETQSEQGSKSLKEIQERLTTLEKKSIENSTSSNPSVFVGQLSTLITELKQTIEDGRKAALAASAYQGLSSVQITGQMFSFYSYTLAGIEGDNFNRFDLDRLYLTARGQIFEGAKLQLTSDLYRNSAAGSYYSGLSLRIKFAMLDYAVTPSLTIKAGMIPTVWPGFVDGIWKYRGVQTSVTDRQTYFPTADLGASVTYLTPDKRYEVAGFVLNGSGYTSPENNRFKDFAVRISASPFNDTPLLKPLLVAGYIYKGANASSSGLALQRDRVGGLVSYSYSGLSAGAEYDVRKDAPSNPDTTMSGNAVSVFGEFSAPFEELKNTLSLIWRYDLVDPDNRKGGDMNRLLILGIAYKVNERFIIVLDNQSLYAETKTIKRNDGTKTDYDGKILVNVILNF